MAELARLHQARTALAMTEVDLLRTRQLRDASVTTLQSVRDEIAGVLHAMPLALPGEMPLPQLEAWVMRRLRALEVRASVLTAERDRDGTSYPDRALTGGPGASWGLFRLEESRMPSDP